MVIKNRIKDIQNKQPKSTEFEKYIYKPYKNRRKISFFHHKKTPLIFKPSQKSVPNQQAYRCSRHHFQIGRRQAGIQSGQTASCGELTNCYERVTGRRDGSTSHLHLSSYHIQGVDNCLCDHTSKCSTRKESQRVRFEIPKIIFFNILSVKKVTTFKLDQKKLVEIQSLAKNNNKTQDLKNQLAEIYL